LQSSLYVALSAQVALQNRLETIAQNVANGNTSGYRASVVKFDSVLTQAGNTPVSYVSSGSEVIKRSSGEVVRTGNPFDVAIRGDGWLAVATAAGQGYTRDGRMRMNPAGDLVSVNGSPILDTGGAPIQLDPTAGQPEIAADGTITQGGRRVGVLGLFSLPGNAQLSRVEGGAVMSSVAGTPIAESAADGVVQGFVEQSNVNAVTEMARLITVQRAFEGVSTTMQAAESSFKNAIQTLGS
jgi:flagellar basal-body rod protein FlgF